MKIRNIRQDFISDHSLISYEFLAIDKPLSEDDKNKISSLSPAVSPTSYRASFQYNIVGHDIPGGWKSLMSKHYDVMYNENYGWWTLAIAFDTTKKQYDKLNEFEFKGYEDLGIDIDGDENRVIITVYCILDPEQHHELDEKYPIESGENGRDDSLLNLLTEIRKQLISEDYRALYMVWGKYYEGDDSEMVAIPKYLRKEEQEIVEDFNLILTHID